jgi:hypothetical protein
VLVTGIDWRNILFGLMLFLVLVHGLPSLSPANEIVRPLLAEAGIDLYMQPITFDMPALYNADAGVDTYLHDVRLTYGTTAGNVTVPWKDVAFYRARVPLMLMVEAAVEHTPLQPMRYALCRELARMHGPGQWFIVQGPIPSADIFGINERQGCL